MQAKINVSTKALFRPRNKHKYLKQPFKSARFDLIAHYSQTADNNKLMTSLDKHIMLSTVKIGY